MLRITVGCLVSLFLLAGCGGPSKNSDPPNHDDAGPDHPPDDHPSSSAVVLTVGLDGDGRGRVTSSPDGISCGEQCTASFAPGTLVVLTAKPAAGSRFAGWSE